MRICTMTYRDAATEPRLVASNAQDRQAPRTVSPMLSARQLIGWHHVRRLS